MTPIKFPQSNIIFAENQPEYLPLPGCITDQGVVVTCWLLSQEEVNDLARSRMLWLGQLTFGEALQPQLPQVENPFNDPPPEVQLYRHYKGGVYRFVSEATFVDTKAAVIVYCSLASGEMFVRDKVEFFEEVQVPGSSTKRVPRFERM